MASQQKQCLRHIRLSFLSYPFLSLAPGALNLNLHLWCKVRDSDVVRVGAAAASASAASNVEMKRLWIFKSSLLTNSSQFHRDNKFEFAMIDWCYCFGVGRMGLGIDILVSPFWFEFTLGLNPIENHFRKVGKYQAIYWNESFFRYWPLPVNNGHDWLSI